LISYCVLERRCRSLRDSCQIRLSPRIGLIIILSGVFAVSNLSLSLNFYSKRINLNKEVSNDTGALLILTRMLIRRERTKLSPSGDTERITLFGDFLQKSYQQRQHQFIDSTTLTHQLFVFVVRTDYDSIGIIYVSCLHFLL
jgi:hypothetical protein